MRLRQLLLCAALCSLCVVGGTAAAAAAAAAQAPAPQTQCRDLLQEFVEASSAWQAAPLSGDPHQMVFFLHIPRTAGGSLNCLLRAGVPAAQRCPAAYRQLPATGALQDCSLLASHDDLSALQELPPSTAVVTELRDPVERVLSAYEFSIQQAAQHLALVAAAKKEAEAAAAAKKAGKAQDAAAAASIITDNVWPWNHLVPFFADDIGPKITALKAVPLEAPGAWTIQRNDDGTRFYYNKHGNASKASLTDEERKLLAPSLEPYDNAVAMPLREFIRHPIAAELLHNNELLQVLGLTNISHYAKAAELRACMREDAAIAEELLQLGIRRLESFAYVGAPAAAPSSSSSSSSSSSLAPSVEALAAALGWSWTQVAHQLTEEEIRAAMDEGGHTDQDKAEMLATFRRRMAAEGDKPLGEDFRLCEAASLTGAQERKSRALRRLRLPDWRQIHFDRTDRATLPAELLEEIRRLNALDARLFQHAQQLAQQQRTALTQAGKLQPLPPLPAPPGPKQPGAAGGPSLKLPEGAMPLPPPGAKPVPGGLPAHVQQQVQAKLLEMFKSKKMGTSEL